LVSICRAGEGYPERMFVKNWGSGRHEEGEETGKRKGKIIETICQMEYTII